MLSKNEIKLIRSLEQKKYRRREGLFVAEGPKVVGDLLKGGYSLHSIFTTQPEEYAKYEDRAHLVTDDELRRISFLQHPQQVLAVLRMPQEMPSLPMGETNGTATGDSEDLVLALDGVQDPGNVGTIIRIPDWFGIGTIYCSLETADAYSPKVVQATMGSLAHVHIIYCNLPNLLSHATVPIYGTLLNGQNIYEQTLSNNGIIVMGNEGQGISPSVKQHITNQLLIPNYHVGNETAESLNVAIATAITCAEFRRRY